MKTHLPTGLRKALIAAIFAVSAVAYNAQAATTYSTDTTVSDIDTTDKVYYDKNIVINDAATVTTTTGGVKANGITVGEYAALNSHGTVSSTDYSTLQSGHVTLETRATLTVENGSVKAAAGLTAKDHAAMTVENGGVTAKRIEIDDYSKAEVNGHVTAGDYIWVTNRSELNVENGHLSVADGALSIDEQSHVSVTNGNVTIDNFVAVDNSSSLEVTGGNINAFSFRAAKGSTVTTDGKLATESSLNVQKHSEVTAKEGVSVSDGSVNVDGGSKLTTEGAITIDAEGLNVNGGIVEAASVTAVSDIQVRYNESDGTPASLIVTGAVTSTEKSVHVEGTAVKHSTLKADTVTAKKAIDIFDADLIADTLVRSGTEVRVTNGSIKGTADIIAAGEDSYYKNISIADSEVEGASLTALKGNISITTTEDADAPTTVTLTGDMKATQGALTITGAAVQAGGEVLTGEDVRVTDGGSLQSGDITISAAHSSTEATDAISGILNNTMLTAGEKVQALQGVCPGLATNVDGLTIANAEESHVGAVSSPGSIIISGSTVEADALTANAGEVRDALTSAITDKLGSTRAAEVTESLPRVDIVTTDAEVTVHGGVSADGSIRAEGGSLLAEGDMSAHKNITAVNADLGSADMTAAEGAISVTNGDLLATGNVSAKESISVTNGSMTADAVSSQEGSVSVSGGDLLATGNVSAAKNVTLTEVDANIAGDVHAGNTVSVTKSTLEGAKLTADKGVIIDDYSDVVLSESLNAGVGSDTEPAKTIVNNHSTLTVEKDVHTEGLEVTEDSTMEVGDTLTSAGAIVVSSTNGSLTADAITTTKGGITVAGGAEMAATGVITSAKGLSVSGTDSAVSAKDITIVDGDILVLDGAALSATGDIKATVTNPAAKAEVLVSGANTSLSAGTLTADKVTIDDGAALEAATVTVKDVLELDKASATISMVKGNISAKNSDVEADHVTGKVTAIGSEIAVEHTIGGGVDAKQDSTVSADRVEGSVLADDSAVTISGAIVDIPTEPGQDPIAADVTVTNAGTVTADSVTVTGKVTVDGAQSALTVEDAISAKEVTADVRGTIEAQTITAETLTVSGDATVKVEDTIDADIKGDGGTIIATGTEDRGLTIDGDVASDNSTFIAAEDSAIIVTGDVEGNGNLFGYDTVTQTPLASDVHIAGDLSGDGNAIYATGELLNDDTPAISVGKDLFGTGNELTVAGDGDLVVVGNVTGDTNELTIEGDGDLSLLSDIDGDGNQVTVVGDGTISLSGDIDGDGNTLTVGGNGDIFADDIYGDNNTLTVEGEGDITIGTLGNSSSPAADNQLTAAQGDITIDELTNNTGLKVTATDGTVTVTNDSVATLTASDIAAKKDITIGGDTATPVLLTLTGDTTVTSEEGNVTLDQNVTIDDAAIEATAGKVTFAGGSNTVKNGATVTAGDTIDVAEGATLNMGADSADALVGKLSGAGSISAQHDDLHLSYDDTAFTGLIDMGNGKTLTISDKGVGADATINLTAGDTALVVTAADASIGHVQANPSTQVSLNPGTADGTATASTLTMQNASTLHIDADATSADCITVTESVSIAQAGTVYVNDQTSLEDIKGDVSHAVIKLADGAVNNGVSEDVRYDMAGGQRILQGKNMSLVNAGDHVDLVISTNYRGTENAKPNQAAVNTTLKELSTMVDHTPGVLAETHSNLAHVLDALDNTRSEAATLDALQSLSAAGNLVVTNMMMDSTRSHLSTLRGHMGAPTCKDTKAGAIKKGNNAWAAYTGGHDTIDSDKYTGEYSRSHQGAIIGTDHSLSCNASVGIALGYESAKAHQDSTHAEADTVFADVYTTVKQGAFTHRFSAGVALHDIDVKRHTFVSAAGHTYTGNSKGSMDAISWNLGYELSYDVKLSSAGTLTPFAAVDVAIHQMDTLREKGQGDASVITKYDEPVQVDVALGAAYTHSFASGAALSASAAIHGELSETQPEADNHFAGVGRKWTTKSAERTPIYGEIGASVAVPVWKTTSVIGGGNFEFSTDRTSVGGHIGVNVKF